MQETNGLELARQIRAIRPELPVILSSGFIANLNREDLRQAGICGLIEKPASMTALAEVTQRALAKPPAGG
jgi:CheY-like chemotaxis protein